MQFVKKNWWVVGPLGLLITAALWVNWIDSSQASNEKAISKLTEISANQQALQIKQQATLEFILKLLTMPVGEEAVDRWRAMPQCLPHDSLGNPISGAEWLSISHGYHLGRTFRWISDDSLLVRVEWDERDE